MAMTRIVSAVEARANFSRILSEAYFKGQPTIVSRNKEPIAVIIGIADYEELLALREQRDRAERQTTAGDAIDEKIERLKRSRKRLSPLLDEMRRKGLIKLSSSTVDENLLRESGLPRYSAEELRQRTAGRTIPIEEIIQAERRGL